ncbi:bifunctional UDP-sugar hydrolase/5'-nucleotidase [Rhodococcus sp. IEGM 1408]|uniref:bifunctional metallophosphatase/5'-nucleotidase n=1 Tax=Rhodococcus sp. IEGM 1408 TaxID=3082220 RepID=UPI002953FD64|nr:bifunctional UDP-sugar hydrolase/5'-nucleotidase [Rhodococcus sp. IEGM 1408]MDV8001084.1 bifunctional UDP-sugar hydrolase/5'-nucleotidase [Rhodococcus sp. IEGM 1408]
MFTPHSRPLSAVMACVLATGALATCTLTTVALVSAPVVAGQTTAHTAPDKVTLLNITDYHGRIAASSPSTVAFADTIESLRAEAGAESSLLLSAGDNVGATLFASSFKDDRPTIDILNALGLAASAVGNHEFDRGAGDLRDRIEPAADWDYLAANVTVDGAAMKGYSLHEVGGMTVGVIGAVTQDTPTLVSPGALVGAEFSDPVDAVNRVAAQLTDDDESNGEADILVAEYHEGAPAAGSIEVARARSAVFDDIVTRTAGSVDAIFTGHTHQLSAWEGERRAGVQSGPAGSGAWGVGSLGSLGSSGSASSGSASSGSGTDDPVVAARPVLQAGFYGSHIGRVTLDVDPETREVVGFTQENVPVPTSATGADLSNPVVAEVKRIVDATLAEAEIVGSQPIGTVTGDITTAYSAGVRDDRQSESALGNLVGQFFKDAVIDRGGADLGFMNPGGLRAELRNNPAGRDGNVTRAEANEVLPFANTLVTLSLTGEQVRRVLEQQWQPADSGRLFRALGTSDNLTWTYDPTRPAGDHITSVTIDGAPLDPAASYRVAVASFLAEGGDNFTAFTEGTDVRDTGLVDSEAWLEYLAEHRADGIAPDFGRRAVAAKNLPGTVQAGQGYSFTLTDLDLTSLGAPTTVAVTVALGGAPLGTFAAVPGIDDVTFGPAAHATPLDGRVDISVTIPAQTPAGETALTITTDTGTVVTVPVVVGAAAPAAAVG